MLGAICGLITIIGFMSLKKGFKQVCRVIVWRGVSLVYSLISEHNNIQNVSHSIYLASYKLITPFHMKRTISLGYLFDASAFDGSVLWATMG